MATFQELISSARVVLNDEDSVRYTDAQLEEYANDAIREMKILRPDWFLGQYTATPTTYTSASTVPVPDSYIVFIKDYLVFRANLRDEEATSESRASAFLSRFRSGVKTA